MSAKKKIGMLAFGVVLCAMFAVSSYAATITFHSAAGRPTTYDGGAYGGGAFDASIDGGPMFQTFCLERNEELSFGTPYQFTVGVGAINGGVAGGSPDIISSQTAYLYSNFHNGTLPGYTNSGADQIALQYAFWYLEESVSLSTANTAGAGTWITLADANAEDGSFYNVQVINPYHSVDGRIVQNQSVLHVPEAGALMLFGSGLIGLIGYRRTRRMA